MKTSYMWKTCVHYYAFVNYPYESDIRPIMVVILLALYKTFDKRSNDNFLR